MVTAAQVPDFAESAPRSFTKCVLVMAVFELQPCVID
jgi:hypothetical protein